MLKEFIKNYIWFIKESAKYLNKPVWYIALIGQVKAIKHSVNMCRWNRLTDEQKLNWYVNENRVIEFDKEAQ